MDSDYSLTSSGTAIPRGESYLLGLSPLSWSCILLIILLIITCIVGYFYGYPANDQNASQNIAVEAEQSAEAPVPVPASASAPVPASATVPAPVPAPVSATPAPTTTCSNGICTTQTCQNGSCMVSGTATQPPITEEHIAETFISMW